MTKQRNLRPWMLAGLFLVLLAYIPADILYRRFSARDRGGPDSPYEKGLYNAYDQSRKQSFMRQDVLNLLGRPNWQRDSLWGYCHHGPLDRDCFLLGQFLCPGSAIMDTTSLTFVFDCNGRVVGRHLSWHAGWMTAAEIYAGLVQGEKVRDWGDPSGVQGLGKFDIERKLPGVKVLSIDCTPCPTNIPFADKRVYDVAVTLRHEGVVKRVVWQYALDNGLLVPPTELSLKDAIQEQKGTPNQ